MRLSPLSPTKGQGRPASITPLLLPVLMVLLAASVVAINHARLVTVRTELQVCADAASLAGGMTLVSDDLLRGNPASLPALLDRCRDQAVKYAGLNPVLGAPYVLDRNPMNYTNGQLIFGTLDNPQATTFYAAQNVSDTTNTGLAKINAIRVNPRLTQAGGNAVPLFMGQLVMQSTADVQAAATVMLDRDVIGLRPVVQLPLPLAPVAFLADYSGTNPFSWQAQVEIIKTNDKWAFTNGAFVSGSDGLYEFNAVLKTDVTDSKLAAAANVALLYLGTTNITDLSKQLTAGVTPAQMPTGGLVLEAKTNNVTVQGTNQVTFSDATTLYNALDALRQSAQPRIWPLYATASSTQVTLNGFVAARVVNVNAAIGNTPLTFTLQPTMQSNAAVVTDVTRRGVNGVPIVNPYVCKVRVVQ